VLPKLLKGSNKVLGLVEDTGDENAVRGLPVEDAMALEVRDTQRGTRSPGGSTLGEGSELLELFLKTIDIVICLGFSPLRYGIASLRYGIASDGFQVEFCLRSPANLLH